MIPDRVLWLNERTAADCHGNSRAQILPMDTANCTFADYCTVRFLVNENQVFPMLFGIIVIELSNQIVK